MRPAVIFIVGPTAIGKTRLAVKLAKRIHGEIISCDSMQVYRGMRILSQAPGLNERRAAKCHLVGFLDPRKEYNAAKFCKRAKAIIASTIKKGDIPIVAGGSGLYVKALIDGLFSSPKADLKFRHELQRYILRYGSKKLHRRLAKIDPDSAKNIHPNDARRIIRALEIYHSAGKTMTELKTQTKGLKDIYDIKIFGLTGPREGIYSNINSRVDRIFARGAVMGEVKRLKRKNLSQTAKAALGFNEVAGYLDGLYDLDTVKELLKRNTRRFAKRQLTWFRADRRIKWFDVNKVKDATIIGDIAREVI